MATGIAVGGLAQGFAQGLQTSMILGKARREQERFDLEKPQLELQAEEAGRQKEFQADLKLQFETIAKDAQGGSFTDESGQTIEKPPMSPFDMQLKMNDVRTATALKYDVLDVDKATKMLDYSKKLGESNVIQATQYILTNPTDGDGFRAMINKGPVKMGQDMKVRVVNVNGMPDVQIYGAGANGQEQVFANSQSLLQSYVGAETQFQVNAANKRAALQEAGANTRTALNNAATLNAAQSKANATYNAELRKSNAKTLGDARSAVTEIAKPLASNPNFAIDPIKFQSSVDNARGLAEQLVLRAQQGDPKYSKYLNSPGQAAADAWEAERRSSGAK